MDGGYKPYLTSKHNGFSSSVLRSAKADDHSEEFEEAEVWEAVHDHHHHHHHKPESRSSNFMKKKSKSKSFASSSSIGAHNHRQHQGGQKQFSGSGHLVTPGRSHSSAGLSLKSSSNPSLSNSYGGQEEEQGFDDDEDDEDEMIPPHEWIARRLARSHISSSSVCEGAGRTLKGRDLSRVRNAVLTKTGFLEQ